MRKHASYALIIIIHLLVITFFLVQYTNATYPMVGHDYRLFITRLIDSDLYYRANGFGIEWYTPNFGAGLPAYPNPLQMQFSLPQLITWFFNPYAAVLVSTSIYVAIGFLVTYLFLYKVLELKPLSAILGADFFLINGFLIERLVIGHVNFLTFPLIIIPIFVLFDRRLPKILAAILLSVVGAALVYSGGVYIAVIGLFSAFIIIPLVYFIKPGLFFWRRMLSVLVLGGLFTALLCGSKLYATASYMRFFPREVHDQYLANGISGFTGMIFQLVGTMNFFPILALINKTSASFTIRLMALTRTPYSFWELDSSIAPGLLFLLVYGVIMVLHRRPQIEKWNITRRKIIAGLFLLFSLLLCTQFSITKGLLYEQLSNLPILQSLHANTRFTAAFILPLAIISAKVFDSWAGARKNALVIISGFAILSGVSLASMWSYYRMPTDIQVRNFDINSINETYQRASVGESFPVTQIVPDMNDYEVFILHSSNTTHHYDPLFRDNNMLLTPLVHAGSIFDVENGYYNFTDPASLVFPEVNNTKLFERIPVTDTDKLLDFTQRRRSDWDLPLVQIILNWISGISIILETLVVLIFLARERLPFLKIQRSRIKHS